MMARAWIGLAAMLACGSAQAQAASPCVTSAEAEALVLFVAPDLIRQTGLRCQAVLPSSALVRQASGPLLAKYEAETERAWPRVRSALAKLVGEQGAGLLDSSLAQPLVGSLVAPMLVGTLKPGDCATVERAVGLVQALPPRNVAALVVLFARADASSASPRMRLPLCAEAR